jgi:hypothetical protein
MGGQEPTSAAVSASDSRDDRSGRTRRSVANGVSDSQEDAGDGRVRAQRAGRARKRHEGREDEQARPRQPAYVESRLIREWRRRAGLTSDGGTADVGEQVQRLLADLANAAARTSGLNPLSYIVTRPLAHQAPVMRDHLPRVVLIRSDGPTRWNDGADEPPSAPTSRGG